MARMNDRKKYRDTEEKWPEWRAFAIISPVQITTIERGRLWSSIPINSLSASFPNDLLTFDIDRKEKRGLKGWGSLLECWHVDGGVVVYSFWMHRPVQSVLGRAWYFVELWKSRSEGFHCCFQILAGYWVLRPPWRVIGSLPTLLRFPK